jgi:hypothetical protein
MESITHHTAYQLIDSNELAVRWRVPKSWIEENTRRRCAEPIPFVKFGKYTRFEWGSQELEHWYTRRRNGTPNHRAVSRSNNRALNKASQNHHSAQVIEMAGAISAVV